MNRRTLLAALSACLFAGTAHAEALSLNVISGYLNGFATATAEFTQINPDGTLSTGQVYIKRPGRVRFEYNPPEKALVVAGGGQVAVFDPKSDQGVDRFPLAKTPLKIMLERNVDFSRSGMVTRHTSDGTRTTVTAQDPAHPEYGNIQLVFTADPVELRQWIVTDETGQKTTVILGDMAKGGSIGDIKFNIQSEMSRRGLN